MSCARPRPRPGVPAPRPARGAGATRGPGPPAPALALAVALAPAVWPAAALPLSGCGEDVLLAEWRAPEPPVRSLAPPAAAPPFAPRRAPDGGPVPGDDGGVAFRDCREEAPPADPVPVEALAWAPGYGLPGIDGPGTRVADVEVRGEDVWVGGTFTIAGGRAARNVARWSDAGGWQPLGEGLPDPVVAVALDPEGRPWAATSDRTDPRLGRVHVFDGDVWVERARVGGEVLALEGTGDGVAVGGDFTEVDSVPARHLALWNGAWSAPPGEPLDGPVRAIVSASVGLCVGGDFRRVDGADSLAFACLAQTGWLDDTALPADAGRVLDLERGPDQAIYVAGEFDLARAVPGSRGGGLIAWTPEGWTDLGPGFVHASGGPAAVRTVLSAGARIVVAGDFAEAVDAPGVPLRGLAEWRPGTGWTAIAGAPAIDDAVVPGPGVQGLAAAPDGSPLAWGDFRLGGTARPTRLATWNGSEWRIPRSPGVPDRGVVGDVLALRGEGACPPLVAGDFARAGNARAEGLTRLDRDAGHLPLAGRAGGLRAVAPGPDGSLVAVLDGDDPLGALARHDGRAWAPIGGGVRGDVLALLVTDDGAVVIGGALDAVGGGPGAFLARHDEGGWHRYDGGPDGPVHALLERPDGALVVAGDFASAGGVATGPVARWDGAGWEALGLEVPAPVTALAIHDGALVVGRRAAEGEPAVLRLDPGGVRALGLDLLGPGAEVYALLSWRGWLLAAGAVEDGLRVVGDEASAPLVGGVDGVVRALWADAEGLWVGGSFGRTGERASAGLAHLRPR